MHTRQVALYYNIYALETEAFLGTIRVYSPLHNTPSTTPPSKRAMAKACSILGGNGAPAGIKAVMSTVEMFRQHGLHDKR